MPVSGSHAMRSPQSNERPSPHFERKAGQMPPQSPQIPLAQSDREERITTWLEARHVPDAWKIAPTIADAGVEIPKLESLAAQVGDEVVGDALTRIASLLTIARLINEIEISTKRISDLVQAIKEYSYMDQAAMKEVDLHQGLENTLDDSSPQAQRRNKCGPRIRREPSATFAPMAVSSTRFGRT